MKKIFTALLLGALALSCDNKEIKQTTDSIKSADSLFRSARDGFKTLDSISAVVNDSARMNRVIVPEIEKTKRQAEDAILKNAKNLDSLANTVNKMKDKLQRGSEIIKTVDSANRELQKDGTIFDKISTVTGAISKVSKQNAKKTPQKVQSADSVTTRPYEPQNEPEPDIAPAESFDPMVKTGKLTIYVDNIVEAKAQLVRDLRSGSGEIVTERFGEEEGRRKEFITSKIPYRYFDQTLSRITSGYGDVTSKSTETEGTEYAPDQMCDLEITFVENAAANDGMAQNNSDTGTDSRAGDAFQKGAKNFRQVMLWLLPFWPFLLIGLIIWFFVARNRRRKREAEIMKLQQEIEAMKAQSTKPQNTGSPQEQTPDTTRQPPHTPDDYSRYMPK